MAELLTSDLINKYRIYAYNDRTTLLELISGGMGSEVLITPEDDAYWSNNKIQEFLNRLASIGDQIGLEVDPWGTASSGGMVISPIGEIERSVTGVEEIVIKMEYGLGIYRFTRADDRSWMQEIFTSSPGDWITEKIEHLPLIPLLNRIKEFIDSREIDELLNDGQWDRFPDLEEDLYDPLNELISDITGAFTVNCYDGWVDDVDGFLTRLNKAIGNFRKELSPIIP